MTRRSHTDSEPSIAVWAITPNGAALAQKIAAALPNAVQLAAERLSSAAPSAERFAALPQAVGQRFHRHSGHVFIMAAGIVVRLIAAHLTGKTRDPAVVVVDDRGQHAVSLLAGHIGGANDLAERVAAALGARPVITTATDVNQRPAVDMLAKELDLRIENPAAVKTVNMALLLGEPVFIHDPGGRLAERIPNAVPITLDAVPPHPAEVNACRGTCVVVDDRLLAVPPGALLLRPATLVAGVGCNRNTAAQEIRELLLTSLREAALSPLSLRRLASAALKSEEPGLLQAAAELGLATEFYGPEALKGAAESVPTPSETVEKHIGVKSVSEAAALLASQYGELVVPKRTTRNATVAVARVRRIRRPEGNRLFIVGIGPGGLEHLTQRAKDVLKAADCIAGYSLYVDQVAPLIAGKPAIRSGMTKEVERVEAALQAALSGRSCALISSGDPGIYAMAGLVFESCKRKGIPIQGPAAGPTAADPAALSVEVVPGVPALCAGAALLGAPLTHDFAVISLSDLLTPWELIAARLEAAARADFVIVLYNPKSKRRNWQLARACEIIQSHRDPDTPVGVVVGATRPNQDVRIVRLGSLAEAAVDMQTTLFVGSRTSSRYLGFIVTPRGYAGKYDIG
jgi:cobalt-precorrin 5A hydrolase/precorrin-3B C17-methyltransferase